MKKFIVAFALLSFISTSMGTAFAKETNYNQGLHKGWEQGKREGFKKHNFELKQKLNLTEDQEARARDIRQHSRDQIKPLIDQIRAEKAKMREMASQNAAQADLERQREKVADLMRQAKEIHKQNLTSFEGILTPDQKTSFEQIRKQRMEEFKSRKDSKINRYNPENTPK